MRYSLRVLLRQKVFAALAITSLSVAIALCSVVYGLFDAMVHPELAIREPGELRALRYYHSTRVDMVAAVSAYNSRLSVMKTLVGAAGAFGELNQYASRGSEVREVRVMRVSPNYFSILGVPTVHGRIIGEGDVGVTGRPVVLSERAWNQWLAGERWSDTARITINGEARPVAGVLAFESDFPGADTDVWQLESPSKPVFRTLVRRRPGISEATMQAEFSVVAAEFASMFNEKRETSFFQIKPAIGKPLELYGFHYALIAAVVAVFLVACLNLANLQLARGVRRTRELATLSAIGASRRDIVRLLMLETTILTAAGLACSVWLTKIGVNVMRAVTPPRFGDLLIQPQVSWRVFAFSASVAVVAAILVGLVPAVRLSRQELHQALKAGEAKVSPHKTWSRGLLVAQVSLALGILVGAGLLARTVVRLASFDFGLPVERTITGHYAPDPAKTRMTRFADLKAVVTRLVMSEPGVVDVATSYSGDLVKSTLLAAVDGKAPLEVWPVYNYQVVSANWGRVQGYRIVEGRDFVDGETDLSAIIDQSTAWRLWPGSSAVGRQIKLGAANSSAPWVRVVGVRENTPSLARADLGEVAVPGVGQILVVAGLDTARFTRSQFGVSFLVRTGSADITPQLRNTIHRRMLDAFSDQLHLQVSSAAQTYQQSFGDRLAKQAFVTGIFSTFGLLALIVAALGIYAAFSQAVALKQREFAVRVALGASASEVRSVVIREANQLILAGIALGLVVAALNIEWLAAFVRSKADRYDSVAYGAVALLVFVTSAVASWIAARRAAPADLMRALSSD